MNTRSKSWCSRFALTSGNWTGKNHTPGRKVCSSYDWWPCSWPFVTAVHQRSPRESSRHDPGQWEAQVLDLAPWVGRQTTVQDGMVLQGGLGWPQHQLDHGPLGHKPESTSLPGLAAKHIWSVWALGYRQPRREQNGGQGWIFPLETFPKTSITTRLIFPPALLYCDTICCDQLRSQIPS